MGSLKSSESVVKWGLLCFTALKGTPDVDRYILGVYLRKKRFMKIIEKTEFFWASKIADDNKATWVWSILGKTST